MLATRCSRQAIPPPLLSLHICLSSIRVEHGRRCRETVPLLQFDRSLAPNLPLWSLPVLISFLEALSSPSFVSLRYLPSLFFIHNSLSLSLSLSLDWKFLLRRSSTPSCKICLALQLALSRTISLGRDVGRLMTAAPRRRSMGDVDIGAELRDFHAESEARKTGRCTLTRLAAFDSFEISSCNGLYSLLSWQRLLQSHPTCMFRLGAVGSPPIA